MAIISASLKTYDPPLQSFIVSRDENVESNV